MQYNCWGHLLDLHNLLFVLQSSDCTCCYIVSLKHSVAESKPKIYQNIDNAVIILLFTVNVNLSVSVCPIVAYIIMVQSCKISV